MEATNEQKLVSPAETKPVEELETLFVEYQHVDFPDLLGGAGLTILYYLKGPHTATELAKLSGLGRSTVYRRLDDLQMVGIVGKHNSQYRVNDPFSTLPSIARGLSHQAHRLEAEEYTSGVNIIWERHDEYLFACESTVDADAFYETGPPAFEQFGIPLLTKQRQYYIRSDRLAGISPAELVSHTLLIDDGSRYRTYCLLLIAAQSLDVDSLRESATQYDPEAAQSLVELVEALCEYLETDGSRSGDQFPEWKEFKQTAADYEIDL
ncbi:helix-turn-helix domain-containing protein [Halobaculum rubrum]|uniref:helix-turn-helix domain-containing protein n=1 Tax=Halobaculum rubrum TaxID=2872158 RepID=UPI001CECB15D|nr:helix-turn-helix domain-containing protein [Halobaculum rubrum]